MVIGNVGKKSQLYFTLPDSIEFLSVGKYMSCNLIFIYRSSYIWILPVIQRVLMNLNNYILQYLCLYLSLVRCLVSSNLWSCIFFQDIAYNNILFIVLVNILFCYSFIYLFLENNIWS